MTRSAETLGDTDFLASVADASLSEFRHRDHLRVAWLCLREDGPEAGALRAAQLISAYAEAKGASSKFDLALTRRWTDRIWAAMEASPRMDFEALFAASPEWV
jgi:hypothetical protein